MSDENYFLSKDAPSSDISVQPEEDILLGDDEDASPLIAEIEAELLPPADDISVQPENDTLLSDDEDTSSLIAEIEAELLPPPAPLSPLIDPTWATYRPVRPHILPEQVAAAETNGFNGEHGDELAYLPPLPYPHSDILWPSTYDTVLKSTDIKMVDLLAAEKVVLQEQQNLTEFYKDETDEEESGWQTARIFAREIVETLILTAIILLLIQAFIRNFRVVGTSMLNNLQDGQYLIIDKVTYNQYLTDITGLGGIQRGDVIVFVPPNHPQDDYVKRVIGLPGETVEVINGKVHINGEPLPEPFQPRPGSYTMPPMTVGENDLFVLGDNRNNSNDSHNWGTLPIENIVGRAWISYWPPLLWGTIPRDRPSEEATLKFYFDTIVPSANAAE